jgi:hypothetical protein
MAPRWPHSPALRSGKGKAPRDVRGCPYVHCMQDARLLERIRRGDAVNVDFADLVRLLLALGFQEVGGRGSHRVFARNDVTELLNLQEEKRQLAVEARLAGRLADGHAWRVAVAISVTADSFSATAS